MGYGIALGLACGALAVAGVALIWPPTTLAHGTVGTLLLAVVVVAMTRR